MFYITSQLDSSSQSCHHHFEALKVPYGYKQYWTVSQVTNYPSFTGLGGNLVKDTVGNVILNSVPELTASA